MRRLARHGRAALATTVAWTVLTGFGPTGDSVRAQLAVFPPAVGIVVATLDNGHSDVRTYGAPLDGDARFEIGSITKTFTATLFADMLVRHEISADDPIDKYLPTGTSAPTFKGRHITLADLAMQSSGLPRMPTNFTPATPTNPYVDYDDAKLLAFLRSYTLTRAPGATFEYSNLGFGLLGYLLARRLHVDYATAIRTRILEPLGMSQTQLETAGHSVATVGGHDADGDAVGNWDQAALAGAGAVVSTPNDMLRYARANLDTSHGPLAAAMRLAQQPTRPAGEGDRIGYAWLTTTDGIVWHNGGTAGFRSFMGHDTAHHRAIIVLANGFIDAVDTLGLHALDPSVPLPAAPAPDATVGAGVLERYVGRYSFSDGSSGVVSRDERGLIITVDAPSFRGRLHARSDTDFSLRGIATADIRFIGSGADMTMIVKVPGQSAVTGKRVP